MSTAGTLLVIDDEPAVADVVRDFFEEQGYSVRCALNGRDALTLASLSRPDAVVLDVRLPDRDGPEVLCDLLALDSSITVVMLSGSDDEELASALLEAGAFDYVRKPFVLDNLQQVLSLRAADQPAGEPEQTGGVLPVHLFERAGRVLTAPFRQA